jgi:hypothetical protein
MSRDHQVGKGDPYVECAISAKTIRKSEAIEQRGLLVAPEEVDRPGASDNLPLAVQG